VAARLPEEPLTTPGAISLETGELGVELVAAVPVVLVAIGLVLLELPQPAGRTIEETMATIVTMILPASDRARIGHISRSHTSVALSGIDA
jgi:hypothetical protein